jgi:glycine cleavage system aminomethyltransferase T
MVGGSTSVDVREMDIARFHTHAFSRPYLRAAASEDYRSVYAIIHPLEQVTHHRNLRLTAFHRRKEELAAVFFEDAGWERPQWYESNEKLPLPDSPRRSGWEARHWSPIIAAEHMATREGVAMFDMTPITKVEVSGAGALDYLQYVAANQMDKPVGTITHTAMLNERGGIRCDLTVTRLERDRFLVLTGASTGPADLAWIRGHMPDDGSISLEDVSSSYCCIGLWGPTARELLREVSTESVSNDTFPYMAARRLMVGDVPVLALRTSYVGELGWELYAKTEFGLTLWDSLWEAGQPVGVVAAGGGAFETLSLEKGRRLWGKDIHSEYNPYEAGLDSEVSLDKGEFLGRSALLRIREEGVRLKLCCMVLDEPTRIVMGKEPILDGERTIGYVTSSNFGYTVGKSIAYGYLPLEHAVVGRQFKIEYFGQRYPVTVTEEPLFDPRMKRPTYLGMNAAATLVQRANSTSCKERQI